MIIMGMVFTAVMTVGLTLLFKDKTKDALDVFTAGGFITVLLVVLGLPLVGALDD